MGRLLAQSAIVVGNVGTYFVLFARCDRYSRSEEDGCKQEEFQVLVHDIVCFRGEYSDLLMLFCRCHDSDSSVYFVVEEALQVMFQVSSLPIVSGEALVRNFLVDHSHVFEGVAVVIEHAVFP